MKEFRNILKAAVERSLDGAVQGNCALLFSGGTDSLTVLWTLLDLGVRPRCYVFRLPGIVSTDSKAAVRAANTWGVELETVMPPHQALTELASDVGEIVRAIRSNRKTHVEVMWAYWHLLRNVRETNVWSGLQADTLYGSSKSMAIKYGKDEQAFVKARRGMVADPNQEGFAQALRLASLFRKSLFLPYTDDGVREFMMRFSWLELNRPRQKMPAVAAFRDEFRRVPIYRRNDNLQCGSGVREHMARMLTDRDINRKGRRGMAGLYKDLGANA